MADAPAAPAAAAAGGGVIDKDALLRKRSFDIAFSLAMKEEEEDATSNNMNVNDSNDDGDGDGSTGDIIDAYRFAKRKGESTHERAERKRMRKKMLRICKELQAKDDAAAAAADGGGDHATANTTQSMSVKDYLNIYGVDAYPSLEFRMEELMIGKNRSALKMRQLQELLLWVLADGVNPKWVFVKNKAMIPMVTVVVIQSLRRLMYISNSAHMPFLSKTFDQALTTQGPGGKVTVFDASEALLNSPLSKNQLKELKKVSNNNDEVIESNNSDDYNSKHRKGSHPGRLHYVVSPGALQAHSFPREGVSSVTVYGKHYTLGDFQSSRGLPASSVADMIEGNKGEFSSVMLALDCEMCETDGGNFELTRVTLVNEALETVLDMLVLPSKPVTNYHTDKSGITAEILEGVSNTRHDARKAILDLITPNTILVGHGLENDLLALHLIHGRVIDTALLYSSPGSSRKPKLRSLVSQFLNKDIQCDATLGHDSIVDAQCAMELVQLKIRNGINFGISVQGSERLHIRLARTCQRKTCMLDRSGFLQSHSQPPSSASLIPCNSDSEVAKSVATTLRSQKHHFVFSRLLAIQDHYEEDDNEQSKVTTLSTVLENVDAHLRIIHESLPRHAMLIVTTGQGDTAGLRESRKRRAEIKSKWSTSDENEFLQEVQAARDGLAWFTIKK